MLYRTIPFMLSIVLIVSTGLWKPVAAQSTALTVVKLSPEMQATGQLVEDSYTSVAGALYFLAQPSVAAPIGLYRASLFATVPTMLLSDPIHAVQDYKLTPDNQHIIYRAIEAGSDDERLYRVSVQGGPITPLNYPEVANETNLIKNYEISFDSQYIVFITNAGTSADPAQSRLYSIKRDGTELRQLDHPATPERLELSNLTLSATDYRIVYAEYGYNEGFIISLYTTFITDTQALFLSTDSGYRTYYHSFVIHEHDLYFIRTRMATMSELVRQPLDGTASTIVIDFAYSMYLVEQTILYPRDMNADSFSDLNLFDLTTQISTTISVPERHATLLWGNQESSLLADNQTVLFLTTPGYNPPAYSLQAYHSVSNTTTLLATSPEEGQFHTASIPDSDHLIYQFQTGGNTNEYYYYTYSEPYRGHIYAGTTEALITNPPAGAIYGPSMVDSTGAWVYVPITINDVQQLYRVPVSGGELEQVNQDLVADGDVVEFFMTSQGIVYKADAAQDEVFELYLARSDFERFYIPLIRR